MAKIDYSIYKSPDEANNLTVSAAHQMLLFMMGCGMPYDTIVALQGTTSGPNPAQEISFNQIIAAKLPADQTFYFVGRYTADPDQKAYTLAEDKAFLFIPQDDGSAPHVKDGFNSFLDVYADRNPSHTIADAEAAADELSVIKTAVTNEFNILRSLVTA